MLHHHPVPIRVAQIADLSTTSLNKISKIAKVLKNHLNPMKVGDMDFINKLVKTNIINSINNVMNELTDIPPIVKESHECLQALCEINLEKRGLRPKKQGAAEAYTKTEIKLELIKFSLRLAMLPPSAPKTRLLHIQKLFMDSIFYGCKEDSFYANKLKAILLSVQPAYEPTLKEFYKNLPGFLRIIYLKKIIQDSISQPLRNEFTLALNDKKNTRPDPTTLAITLKKDKSIKRPRSLSFSSAVVLQKQEEKKPLTGSLSSATLSSVIPEEDKKNEEKEEKIDLKQFLTVPTPSQSQNHLVPFTTWQELINRFSNKKPECLHSHLLELSEVLSKAHENKKISLNDPTIKTNIEDILNTLPQPTSTLDLIKEMEDIIEKRWKISQKKLKEDLESLATEENLSKRLQKLSGIIITSIGNFDYFTNPVYVRDNFYLISKAIKPILESISPTELDLIKEDENISNFLKICIEINLEGKGEKIPDESKTGFEHLTEVERRFKAIKMYVRMAVCEGSINDVDKDNRDIWNKSIFQPLDNDIERALLEFNYVIEIIRRLRPDFGNTGGFNRVPLGRGKSLRAFVYNNHVNTKLGTGRDQSKDTIVKIYVKKCEVEQLKQLSKTDKNAFPMVTDEPETLIDKLFLDVDFKSHHPERLQATFDFLIAKDICVKAIFNKANLTALKKDPQKLAFIQKNFIYLLRAAVIYKNYSQNNPFKDDEISSAIETYQTYAERTKTKVKELKGKIDTHKITPMELIKKFYYSGIGIKLRNKTIIDKVIDDCILHNSSLPDMLYALQNIQKEYLAKFCATTLPDKEAIKLSYCILLLSEYAKLSANNKKEITLTSPSTAEITLLESVTPPKPKLEEKEQTPTLMTLAPSKEIVSTPSSKPVEKKKELTEDEIKKATHGLLKEMKHTTPSKAKVINFLKAGAKFRINTMTPERISIAHALLIKFKNPEDINEIKIAGGLPKDAKEEHVNWIKSQLLYSCLNINEATTHYTSSLDKFIHALKYINCYTLWTYYFKKDGFMVFFKNAEAEKAFNLMIEHGLKKIEEFDCKDILEEIRKLPYPPTKITTSSYLFWSSSRSLIPKEITDFHNLRSQMISTAFDLLNTQDKQYTQEEFFQELKSGLLEYEKYIPAENPIYQELNNIYKNILILINNRLHQLSPKNRH